MGAQLGRSVMRIGSGILVSRILGLVREQVFAFLLGAGKLSDAFIVAFRIPNLLRDLFAEGALSQAFIPVFTGIMVNESREKAYAFANKVLFLLLIILGILTALGYLFTVPLVQILMRDRPFVVETVRRCLAEHGWPARRLLHVVLGIERDQRPNALWFELNWWSILTSRRVR